MDDDESEEDERVGARSMAAGRLLSLSVWELAGRFAGTPRAEGLPLEAIMRLCVCVCVCVRGC